MLARLFKSNSHKLELLFKLYEAQPKQKVQLNASVCTDTPAELSTLSAEHTYLTCELEQCSFYFVELTDCVYLDRIKSHGGRGAQGFSQFVHGQGKPVYWLQDKRRDLSALYAQSEIAEVPLATDKITKSVV